MRHVTFLRAISAMGAFGLLALTQPAHATDDSRVFEQPWGLEFGQSEQAFEPGTRDANGNRVIVNGRMNDASSTLPMGLGFGGEGFGGQGFGDQQGIAVGNQLNVVTNGSFNTVIIENNQVNSGDQTVVQNGGPQ